MEQTTRKSFWSKPEGKFGAVVLLAGIAGLVFALPAVIGIITNLSLMVSGLIGLTLKVAMLGVIAALITAVLYLATNQQVQVLVSFFFQLVMKKITGVVIQIDPIEIMRSYARRLQAGLERMYDSRNKLKGQVVVLQQLISKQDATIQTSLKRASRAKEMNNLQQATIEAREAERNRVSNEQRLKPALQKMTILSAALDKLYNIAELTIQDINNEITHQERERKAILAAYSAMSEARAIINGNTSAKQLYEDALAFTQEDYGNKIAEIQQFMDDSHSLIETFDFNNGIMEQDALDRLADWEKKSDKILMLDNVKPQPMSFSTNRVAQPVSVSSGYDKYM